MILGTGLCCEDWIRCSELWRKRLKFGKGPRQVPFCPAIFSLTLTLLIIDTQYLLWNNCWLTLASKSPADLAALWLHDILSLEVLRGFLLLVLLSASGLHIAPPLIVSITPPQASIQHRMAIAGLGKKSAEAQLPSQQILYKLFVLQCVGSCWLYTFCMYLFPFALYGANRVVPRQRIWDKLNQGLAQLRQTVDIMCP